MRGRFLKERFDVNGIQKASRSLGFGACFSAGRDMRKLLLMRSYTSLGLAQEPKAESSPRDVSNLCPIKVCLPYFGTVPPSWGKAKATPFASPRRGVARVMVSVNRGSQEPVRGLVIEDDPPVRRLTAAALIAHQNLVRIREATNLVEGIALLHDENFSAAVLSLDGADGSVAELVTV